MIEGFVEVEKSKPGFAKMREKFRLPKLKRARMVSMKFLRLLRTQ
jgi:hypothetical protein